MVIDAGCYGNDTKSTFTNFILNKCKTEYPAVWHKEGGKKFDSAVKNNGSGNPHYLILPNKTFKKYPSSTVIKNAGGNKPHVCQTSIATSNTVVGRNTHLYNFDKNGFIISKLKSGDLTLLFYSSTGKLVKSYSKSNAIAGIHTFNWKGTALTKGVYIAYIHANNTKIIQKVVIK